MKDFLRSDVVFSNVSGAVTRLRHRSGERKTDYVVITGEFVKVMLVSVLPVGMVVQSAHHDRPARGATCGGCVGVEKDRSVFGESIDGRSPRNLVSIASKGR